MRSQSESRMHRESRQQREFEAEPWDVQNVVFEINARVRQQAMFQRFVDEDEQENEKAQ